MDFGHFFWSSNFINFFFNRVGDLLDKKSLFNTKTLDFKKVWLIKSKKSKYS